MSGLGTEARPEMVGAILRSLLNNLRFRLFFPFYPKDEKRAIPIEDLPKLDYSKDAKQRTVQLQDAIGKDASIAEWYLVPDYEAIEGLFSPSRIDGDGAVSLFEAAIMIGARLFRRPWALVIKAPEFFADELLSGALDPRDPITRIRWSDRPNKVPDLDWLLSPDDLQAYTDKRWGKGVYTPEELDEELDEEPAPDRTPAPVPGPQAIRTLYRVIRALTLALAEANPDQFKKHGRPFVGYHRGSVGGIVGHLIEGKLTDLRTSTLEEHISKALKD